MYPEFLLNGLACFLSFYVFLFSYPFYPSLFALVCWLVVGIGQPAVHGPPSTVPEALPVSELFPLQSHLLKNLIQRRSH